MATSSSSLPASRRSSASPVGGLAAAAAGPPPPRSKSTVSFGELGGSGGGAIKRRSTQDHIDQILETGRSRADNMGTGTGVSEGSNPAAAARPRSRPAISEDGEPNETTGIAAAGGQHHNHGTFNSTRRRKIPTADSPNQNGVEAEQRPHDEEVKDEKSWLADYLSGLWTIELENTGSTARDHLALERTFLAWLRTSLGFASIGIAITQLFRLNTSLASGQGDDPHLATIRHIGKPLGATFIGISILVLLLGYMRYYQSQQWVMKGKFPASRGAIILVSLISFALMAVSLTVVIVVQPTTVRAQ